MTNSIDILPPGDSPPAVKLPRSEIAIRSPAEQVVNFVLLPSAHIMVLINGIVDMKVVPRLARLTHLDLIPRFNGIFILQYDMSSILEPQNGSAVSDYTLEIGGVTFYLHTAILAARCPKFLTPDRSCPVDTSDLERPAFCFKELLDYIYSDTYTRSSLRFEELVRMFEWSVQVRLRCSSSVALPFASTGLRSAHGALSLCLSSSLTTVTAGALAVGFFRLPRHNGHHEAPARSSRPHEGKQSSAFSLSFCMCVCVCGRS